MNAIVRKVVVGIVKVFVAAERLKVIGVRNAAFSCNFGHYGGQERVDSVRIGIIPAVVFVHVGWGNPENDLWRLGKVGERVE